MQTLDIDRILQGTRIQSLAGQAYQQLFEMIQLGRLPAGTLLQERNLAEALDISRTPVREALSRLEHEGFAVRVARGQLAVKAPSVHEYMEILRVRALLEGESAWHAATRLDLDAIEVLTQQVTTLLETPPEARTSEHLHRVDDALHNGIAVAADNQLLARMVADLRLKTRVFDLVQVPERFEPGCREHLTILDRLRSRDTEGARAAMEAHIGNVRQSIINRLAHI
ncbi:GntR family transcriptional regulator [Salinicola rhizosphaerae]|uniref:GntR family transcriptional regulator n=1 Tax=Salinicola rhizosphaerae TaxID=1443141 RepID=A0ABQ3DW50_9GAMM|nr:GntR family transcriptional regulator [Salinicola rhizosphaerae]GHB18151.1 GntR family transcriptional regulator [Salinicola rhizosphaerae]